MIKSANIATYPPRLQALRETIKSIYNQFDVIRIYFNEYDTFPQLDDPDGKILRFKGDNIYDNGKFIGMQILQEEKRKHEVYFTIDDDLLYPPDYVLKTCKAIDQYGCIISHHGRKLLQRGVKYYQNHTVYHFANAVVGNYRVDVCGTGVTAFRTDYFMAPDLCRSDYFRVSDLVFSLEVAKQKKRIGVIAHEAGWIRSVSDKQAGKETIHDTESNGTQTNQVALADQIFDLNYGTKN